MTRRLETIVEPHAGAIGSPLLEQMPAPPRPAQPIREDAPRDVVRALRLKQRGYRTWTQSISDDITPKNRLLIGEPRDL